WSIGIPATCNAHGAADPTKNQKPKWKAEHSEQLRGADIVVIPDHDPAGYAHADATCEASRGIAKSVPRPVRHEPWPECPKGGDVSDWLDAGHTREELDALIASAPESEPEQRRFRLKPFNTITITTAPNYRVKGILPRTGLVVVWGPPKCGKSFWTFDLV